MKTVGYLVNHQAGLEGERGVFFDYVLASNGLFIEAEGPYMAARIPVAEAKVRGLAPLEPQIALRHGLIPDCLFELALSEMLKDPGREKYVAVTWKDGYHLYVPEQQTSGGSVKYSTGENVVLDLHSHGGMGAFFSATDDRDEQGLRLFGVVGHLDGCPELLLRCGVYGYFHPLEWEDVFEGICPITEGEETQEEVTALDNRPFWRRWFSKATGQISC